LILVTACSSPPETRYYDIRLPDPAQSEGPRIGCVKVEEVAVPHHLDGPEIFYRSSTYEAGYYGYHQWVRPLSDSLFSEIVAYLGKTGRFERVVGPTEPLGEDDVRLRISVREFTENDGDGDAWIADVHVAVKLGDGGVAQRRREMSIRRSVPISPRNAAGVVAALNEAWAQVAAAIVDEILSFADSGG